MLPKRSTEFIIFLALLFLSLACIGNKAQELQRMKNRIPRAEQAADSNKKDEGHFKTVNIPLTAKRGGGGASNKNIIDLSYQLDNNTLHWPKNPGFTHQVIIDKVIERNNSNQSSNVTTWHYIYSDAISTGIHCGTHLDAPRHFNLKGWTVEQIPLERLVNVPIRVVNLSDKVSLNRDYSFTKNDFIEANINEISAKNSVILVYTGLSKNFHQGVAAYFGTNSGNMTEMKVPGFSKEAAEYLAKDVSVYGVGLDAPSADSSQQHLSSDTLDAVAHEIFTSHNIYVLENLSDGLNELLVEQLSLNQTFNLVVAPLAIINGSGSPVRALAIRDSSSNSCRSQSTNILLTAEQSAFSTSASFNLLPTKLAIIAILFNALNANLIQSLI